MDSEPMPVGGILPKQDTQADQFVANWPAADGRGIVVAIFDTGVDPSCEGLQWTSENKPKIIDIVDAAGGGDVDTSAVVRQAPAADGSVTLRGLSGRTLQVCLPNVF